MQKSNPPESDFLQRYFGLPEFSAFQSQSVQGSGEPGFFRWQGVICFGRLDAQPVAADPQAPLYDVDNFAESAVEVPFSAEEVIENLLTERYVFERWGNGNRKGITSAMHQLYYLARPWLPVRIRRPLQRFHLRGWKNIAFPSWPLDTTVDDLCERLLAVHLKAAGSTELPFIWFWPKGYRAALVMTHDVETATGRDFCIDLADLDRRHGIRSSFQFVPFGRYSLDPGVLRSLSALGCELNIHGYNHDGRLFSDRAEFERRQQAIAAAAESLGARGFRSPVLYRNPDWICELGFSYDMSFPNVAHLDPQRGGCCTVRPFMLHELIELPLTCAQDYTIFHILKTVNLDLWKKQVAMLLRRYGLIMFNTHPDYLLHEPYRGVYRELLAYLGNLSGPEKLWLALPGEVADWWRWRREMRLVRRDGHWRIEGERSELAQIAWVRIESGDLSLQAP